MLTDTTARKVSNDFSAYALPKLSGNLQKCPDRGRFKTIVAALPTELSTEGTDQIGPISCPQRRCYMGSLIGLRHFRDLLAALGSIRRANLQNMTTLCVPELNFYTLPLHLWNS